MLAFFEWPEVEPVAEKDHGYPVKGPFVFDHISFGVEAEESLWLLKERLDAAGFWVSEMIDHGFIHSIYAFDPNGIPIEFSCPARGWTSARPPGWSTGLLPPSLSKVPTPSPAIGLHRRQPTLPTVRSIRVKVSICCRK